MSDKFIQEIKDSMKLATEVVMIIHQEDLSYLVGLLEAVADPAGDGVVYHEVRLCPKITKTARERWAEIKKQSEETNDEN